MHGNYPTEETMIKLRLYGTAHCHLCDHASELLNALQPFSKIAFSVETVDITDNLDWIVEFEQRIPVLEYPETAKQLDWPFQQIDVLRLLEDA